MKNKGLLFYLIYLCLGVCVVLLPMTPIPRQYHPYFLFLFVLLFSIAFYIKTYKHSRSIYSKILAVGIFILPIIYFIVVVLPSYQQK